VHFADLTNDPLLAAGVLVLGSALALLMAVGLATLIWRRPQPVAPPEPERRRPSAARDRDPQAVLRREVRQLTAYAMAAIERAAEARAAAAEARGRSAMADAVRDSAWRLYDTAESPIVTAPVSPIPVSPIPVSPILVGPVPVGQAPAGANGQDFAHAAFVAYRYGAINARELQQVWTGADRPDPQARERQRVADGLAVRQREAQRGYDRAAAAARLAREAAQVAEVAAEALSTEALEAEREAREAHALLNRRPGQPHRRR
jgi:hypothetical protein